MTISPGGRLRAALARLPRDRRGFVAVMVALLIPAFVGLAGLGTETGLWYAIKRQNQSAADEAAISGAMEVAANVADITAQATTTATSNGFNNNAPNTITVNNPPSSGPNLNNQDAVEVILSQQQGGLFASLYMPNVTIKTRAVATALSNPSCVLALGTPQSNPAVDTGVTISGAASVNIPGCSLDANSNFNSAPGAVSVTGGATLTASAVVTPGAVMGCANCTKINGTTVDLYAARVTGIMLPAVANCANDPNANNAIQLNAGCYKGMTFQGNANATLGTGTYFVAGDLTIHGGAKVSGGDVTFVVYNNGKIAIQAGNPAPTVTLTAPSSGGVPYQGLVIYQVAADTKTADFSGCSGNPSSCTFTGAIYVPGAGVTFTGSSSSNCTVLTAQSVTFSGSSTLNASQCGADGVTTPSNLTGAVALAE